MAFYNLKNGLCFSNKCLLSVASRCCYSSHHGATAAASSPILVLDDVRKMYTSNSLLTFHPDEKIFTDEHVWKERFMDSFIKRHSRFEQSLPTKCNFTEMNSKFKELMSLKQQLKSLNKSARDKHDFQVKKQLRHRLLDLRQELLLDWLAVPNAIEADVPLSADLGDVVQQFCYTPLYEELPKSSGPSFSEPEFLPSVAPGAIYYNSNLAVADHLLKSFVADRFRSKFLQMSCPDTLRLPAYLGSLSNWPPDVESIDHLIINNPTGSSNNASSEQQPSPRHLLLENSFVLTGCSPQTLLGAFAKQLIKKKYFPKLVFSQGELYYFATVPQQKSVVSFLAMGHAHSQCMDLFTETATFLQSLLQSLRLPFHCVNVSANRLLASESKRLDFVSSIDDDGNGETDKVTYASLSMNRDYFSRRLEIFATTDSAEAYRHLHFPHIASGVVDLKAALTALTKRFCVNRVAELLTIHQKKMNE